MFSYKYCYTCHKPSQETEFVAGPMEGTNVDNYNPEVITVADDVAENYPSSPGIRLCKYIEHNFYNITKIPTRLGQTNSNGSNVSCRGP